MLFGLDLVQLFIIFLIILVLGAMLLSYWVGKRETSAVAVMGAAEGCGVDDVVDM